MKQLTKEQFYNPRRKFNKLAVQREKEQNEYIKDKINKEFK